MPGGITHSNKVVLFKFNTGESYPRLKAKIEAGGALFDDDVMRLIILPLTQTGKERKHQLVKDAM